MPLDCFLLKDSGLVALWLRRYCADQDVSCPIHGYRGHSAMTALGDISSAERVPPHERFPKDDVRWPTACLCGRPFADRDARQVFSLRVYVAPDGSRVTIHPGNAPGLARAKPGAMWLSEYCPGAKKHPGPYLWVILPTAEYWCVDGASTDPTQSGWVRAGIPPDVTAHPSIETPHYHGWLRNGRLYLTTEPAVPDAPVATKPEAPAVSQQTVTLRRRTVHAACGTETTMSESMAKIVAQDPGFFATFECAHCKNHFPAFKDGTPQFTWAEDGTPVGA